MAASSIEALDPAILAAVHEAIKSRLTIDQIVALIRGRGGDASRSAVGRYTKNFAELAKQQRDMRSVAEAFGREFGEADDRQGRMMTQLMTSLVTRTIMPLTTDEDVELDGLELSRLAKAVKDAAGASKIDIEREAKIREEEAKRARAQAADAAERAGRASGATPQTLAAIRAGILGIDQ